MKKIIIKRSKIIIVIAIMFIMVALSAVGAMESNVGNTSTNAVSAVSTTTPTGTAIVLPGPYESFVDSFNPYNTAVYPSGLVSLIYEPLFQVDPLNGTTIPWLATGYNWTHNDLTLQVNLRHNVTFSNGEPFNAADVVFTFNMLKEYPGIDAYDVWAFLRNVTAVNNYEVNFNYNVSDVPSFYYINLVYIIPEDIWQNVSNPATYTDKNPIGTGPFVLTSVTSSEIMLSANAHYWMPGEPHLAHIVYYAYTSDNAADIALEDGDVSWAGLFLPDLNSLYVSKDPSNYGYYYAYSTPIALYTNDLRYPLNETYFREAISLSINRTKLYLEGEYGYEPPAIGISMVTAQINTWLNSTNIANAKTLDQYNITEAKAILSANGWAWNSKGILTAPNGTEIPKMTIMTPSGYTDWDADISFMANELNALGMRVTVVTPVYTTLFSYWETGNYWLIQEANPESGPSPYYGFHGEYSDGGHITPSGSIATTDQERWNSSIGDFEIHLNEFKNTSSLSVQKKLANEMASVVISQVPTVQLVQGAVWYEYNNKTIGGFPTKDNNYWEATPFGAPTDEIIALHLYAKKVTTPTVSPIPDYVYGIIAAVVILIAGVGIFESVKRRKVKQGR